MNDRFHPPRMDDKTDAKNQERERRKVHAETRYTGEDFSIEHPRPERRHRRRHRSRAARSRTAASPLDGDPEEFLCGGQDIPLQPRHSRDQQHSRRHGKGVNFRVREGPKYPPNDSGTHAQLADQARPSNRLPVAATKADKPAEGATEKIIHIQQHAQGPAAQAKNKNAARDGGGALGHLEESITAPLRRREAREVPVDIAHTSRARVHDNSHSNSSDSGYGTPDDDSEVSRTGDDDDDVADDGDAPELSIRIKR